MELSGEKKVLVKGDDWGDPALTRQGRIQDFGKGAGEGVQETVKY